MYGYIYGLVTSTFGVGYHNMPGQIKLISGRANIPLAEKIASYLGIPLTKTEITDFKDGEFRVQVKENIRGSDVFIIQGTNPPADNLLELLMLIETARRASADKVTAVIPYFGYGRQDRKDRPRVGITAKLVANLISVAGADRVVTLDLHAPQIQGFWDIPSDHLFANPVFLNQFHSMHIENPVMLSPDIGSVKMVRSFASALHCGLAVVDKRRTDYNKSEVVNVIGEVRGMRAIIRDDICDTAGTLTDAARADELRSQHIPYVAENQRLRVLRARILRRDGSDVGARQGDTPRLSETEFNLYYDTRLRVLRFDELENGDLVEIGGERFQIRSVTPR